MRVPTMRLVALPYPSNPVPVILQHQYLTLATKSPIVCVLLGLLLQGCVIYEGTNTDWLTYVYTLFTGLMSWEGRVMLS